MAFRLVLTACLASVLALGSALAARGAQTTFKSGVDLVRFDVRVADGAGRPITDIRAEDIEILENGRLLPVVLFQRITEPAESYVDAAIRAVTAEVSSNEAFPRGHLYILVFDQQHITPGNEQRARVAAEQFIRRRVRPSDRVALFAIPGPGPQLGFTADRTRAIHELTSIRGSYERTITSALGRMAVYEAHRVVQGDEKLMADLAARMAAEAGADLTGGSDIVTRRAGATEEPAITRRLLQENARALVNQTDSASRQFLQRLADVIGGFREIEGRKTVVLFSEGFFQDNLSRELEMVAAAAAQSYCVFHTFDLNQRSGALTDAQAPETTLATEIQARIAPLSTLAVETDGMMVVDAGNRSGAALDALAAQAQEYYLVGFTPSEQARLNRGKYRRVTIKVKRPGARVSARTGYALGPEMTPADRRRAIGTVLGAPFVQQGLRIDYTTYVMKTREAAGRHRVVLSLTADLPVRSKATDTADVVFVARDVRDGRVVASGTDTIRLPESMPPGAALGSGTWRVQFTVPPGSYLMRAVVREPGGLVGSADRRIDVRPLDGPDVTASDLVLGSALAGLPVRPRAYAGERLSGVLETYARTPAQLKDIDVRVDLRQSHDAPPVASLKADLQEAERDEGGGVSRRATFLLPLDRVRPGRYLAHAVVTARGEVVAERTRQLEVLEGLAPAAETRSAAPPTVSPLEITRGALAQTYLAWLGARAQETTLADTARRAVEGRWEEVELDLKRLTNDVGVVPQALGGFARFVREDYPGAAAAFDRALSAEPKGALTAFFLGWAYEGAGDTRAAIGAWRNAAFLDPTLVSAHLALADGYLKLSQPALAVQALKAGLTTLPSSPELLNRLDQIERRQ